MTELSSRMKAQGYLGERSVQGQDGISTFICSRSTSEIRINGVPTACQILLVAYVSDKLKFCFGDFWGKKVWEVSGCTLKPLKMISFVVLQDMGNPIHSHVSIDHGDRVEHFDQTDFPSKGREFFAVYAATTESVHAWIFDNSSHLERNKKLLGKYGDESALYFVVIGLILEHFPQILD